MEGFEEGEGVLVEGAHRRHGELMKHFSEQESESIQSTIAQVEKNTSGEIVVVTSERSDDYLWIMLLGALLGDIGFSLFSQFFMDDSWFAVPWLPLIGILLGGGLLSIPALQRKWISRNMEERVDTMSRAAFVTHGLNHTRDETGILIYISFHEHRVEILADRGIHNVLGQEYWEKEAREIAQGVREKRFVETLCQAIRDMGEKLALHFPKRPDDKNELPDTVR